MNYKDKLQHLKEDLLVRHSNLTAYVEGLTGDVREVVELLLEADSLYEIFKTDDTFESYERIIYQVVHALKDDGEMVVKRKVDNHLISIYEKLAEATGKPYKTPYTYYIEEDHVYESKSLTVEQLKMLLSFEKADKVFEEIYEENQYDN